ncbi:peptide ABC transporter substrate-binding protein [Paenibacillus sp. 481]|uniref:peptide ABC transporter substrate-binding protein n=1 Tax=Paenibacillus sp. 481 TaxID=2835869 RepID=UPI001E5AD860|nr:peptide ABC transporter substrate-binding protein [Paenibacillus sp. 481]UHA72786.1 peptide ABC transporter substrate-binding protein [Paenibacillus sp. 481]
MKRKSMLLVLTLLLAVSAFVSACGGGGSSKDANTTQKENNSGNQAEEKKSDKPQVFRFNIHSEPPTLDPGLAQDTVSYQVLTSLFEGLARVDEKGREIPGIAEKWEIAPDGKQYTFTLRKDAKWSNGDPVTAHDFEYAWKRVLDPNTVPAPPYAIQLYYLKNAKAYHEKKKQVADVGVKATDDYTLKVELEHPTPYFLTLLSFQTYFPVHKSVKDNPKWAAEADTIISNGAFKLSTWKHQDSLELTPNEHYYARKEIKFDKVQLKIVTDSATELSMYETDEIDHAGKPTGELPTDQIPILKESKKDEINQNIIAGTYYYLFNNKQAPFDNVNIRKALAMSIDRKLITEKVAQGGQIPAYGMVAKRINGLQAEYRDEVKDDYFKENLDEAKTLLAKGLQEKGLTALPEFTLIHNSNDLHRKVAQAIADMWAKNLNIKVKIENQEWGVFLKTRDSLNYQVARAGWNTDYNDPMSFLDLYTTESGNNDIGYTNKKFDELVNKAKTMADPAERMKVIAEAEKQLIQEDMAIMPIFYYSDVSLTKPHVKNVFLDYQGFLHFTRGYIE